jgi:cysteine synthase A
MCTLIHNVLQTDFVILIKDEETVQGIKIFRDGTDSLVKDGREIRDLAPSLRDVVRPIRNLQCARCDQIGEAPAARSRTTTSSRSPLTASIAITQWWKEMNGRYLEVGSHRCSTAGRTMSSSGPADDHVFDFRKACGQGAALCSKSRRDWVKFGYTKEFLDSACAARRFWDAQYAKVRHYNQKIVRDTAGRFACHG